MSNYRPASLLLICDKHFEKTIFDKIFQHLMENNLLNPNQSSFIPGYSCIHQLISITYKIYMSLLLPVPHESLEVFLDISKAFDQVWHEGLIYKTKYMAVTGDLQTLIKSFLFERQQRVVVNEQESGNQIWCASGFNSLVHYFFKNILTIY